jgi:RHS repeat-associated protein
MMAMDAPPTQYCYGTASSIRRYHLSFGKVLFETLQGMTQKTHYIYAGDERIAEIDYNGTVYYYINDHLGTTRAMVRGSDGVVAAKYYRYGAYGKTMSEMVNIVNQPNKYTNKPFDSDLGLNLYYFGARYYDPRTGRWPSVDPMRGKYPGWSPYVYAMDNPLRFIDRDGRSSSDGGPEEDDPNKQKIVGQPPSPGEIGQGLETKVTTAVNQAVETAKPIAVSALGTTETVAGALGNAAIIVGAVTGGNPGLIGAGVALNRIAVTAGAIKFAINPTAANAGSVIANAVVGGGSRVGAGGIKQFVKQGKLAVAEARVVAAEAIVLEEVSKKAISISVENGTRDLFPGPVQ